MKKIPGRIWKAACMAATLAGAAPCVRAKTSPPPAPVEAVADMPELWQESLYFDGLQNERTHGRATRQSADPNLLPVLKMITLQIAQQAINLRQIEIYTKIQQENLESALLETDPSGSMATIQANLDTLAKSTAQVRNNLSYLGVRCRLASSQALPDPALTKTVTTLMQYVQATQLQLNSLYNDASLVQAQLKAHVLPKESFLTYNSGQLIRSAQDAQSSVLALYNASFEIYQRSKE